MDCDGRTIWIVDAHRDDGKRFIARADEKLTAFMELEAATRFAANWFDTQARFPQNSALLNGSESGGGHFPARFFAPPDPQPTESTQRGNRKEEP
jgi:hypothetical protein